MLEEGFTLSPGLRGMVTTRKTALERLPATWSVFVRADGARYAAKGTSYMCRGESPRHLVDAVKADGGGRWRTWRAIASSGERHGVELAPSPAAPMSKGGAERTWATVRSAGWSALDREVFGWQMRGELTIDQEQIIRERLSGLGYLG